MGIKIRHLQLLRPVVKVISMSFGLGVIMFLVHTRSIAEIPRDAQAIRNSIDAKVKNTIPKSASKVEISEFIVNNTSRQEANSDRPRDVQLPSHSESTFIPDERLTWQKSPPTTAQQYGNIPPVGSNDARQLISGSAVSGTSLKQPVDSPAQHTTQETNAPFNRTSSSSGDRQRVILLWNAFFTDAEFGVQMGEKLFENTKCSKACRLTSDRSELLTADAVVVHAFHLLKDLANASIPERASREQIFVFLILENPYRSYPGMFNLVYSYIDIFNLTMTYLNDPATDIYTPYGALKKRIPPDPFAVPSMASIKAKPKKVVWLVSNCHAPSARYEYVDLLSKHIEVDIFGKCGEDTCPKGEICLDLKDKEYLFYLAFENGYCRDYITEKTFRTLGTTNMVPVVLGGGNYTRYLPRHSFIDVRDFNSPRDLAAYLTHLSENRAEYMRYLLWKKDFMILTTRSIRRRGFCRLCEILHDDRYPYKSRFDPLRYWAADMCLMGDDEREALHIF